MRPLFVGLLAAVMAGCATATTPSPSGSVPIDSPDPAAMLAGDLVETTVDRLRLRDEPGLGAPSLGYLSAGTSAILVEGPVEADGYTWYRIAFVGLPWGTGCETGPDADVRISGCWPPGWVAEADLDGSAWLVQWEGRCPAIPTSVAELAALPPGISAACFDDRDLVLAAYLSPKTEGRGCYPGYDHVPAWLGPCPVVFLQGSETEFAAAAEEIAANLHPDLGACDFGGRSPEACPMVPYLGQWITVTGHYNDPAAEKCSVVPWEENEAAPDDAFARHQCRHRFVITAVQPGTPHGRRVAAVVPIEDLELIEALEDARDLDDVRAALTDPANRERIAWEDLKAQLGL